MADNEPKKGAENSVEAPDKKEAGPSKNAPKIKVILAILIAVVISGSIGTFFVIKTIKSRAAAKAAEQMNEVVDLGSGVTVKPEEIKNADPHAKDAKKDDHKDDKKVAKDPHDMKKEDIHGENESASNKPVTFGDVYKLARVDVNLGNPVDSRFLRIALGVEYRGGESQLGELKARDAQLVDIVISTSSTRTRVELLTDVGKESLRRDLMNRFNEVLDRPVANVFFTEFLVE